MDRREKRDSREKEIVETTIALFSERGFLGVRMSDIAREAGYSMGTIYSHFESKEDLLIACAYMLNLDQNKLFDELASRDIPAIEKIVSLAHCSWMISMQHPDLIEIDNLSLMPSVWRRATTHRAELLTRLHVELADTFLNIVLAAIEHDIDGHGALDEGSKKQLATYFTHGMWGLCVGLSSTAQSGYASTLCPERSDESNEHFTTNYMNFLKGYGWQEKNPEAVFERCLKVARECIATTRWFAVDAEQHS